MLVRRQAARLATTRKVGPVGFSQKLLWKLYVGVIGAVATIVAQRLVTAGWKLATGDKPPDPTNPRTSAVQAFSWALASGVGVGMAQLAARRLAARHWGNQVGNSLPEGGDKIKLKI